MTRPLNESCKHHDKYDGSWWVHDARGVPLCRVCDFCRTTKLSKYRPEVLTNPSYTADEPIEED